MAEYPKRHPTCGVSPLVHELMQPKTHFDRLHVDLHLLLLMTIGVTECQTMAQPSLIRAFIAYNRSGVNSQSLAIHATS